MKNFIKKVIFFFLEITPRFIFKNLQKFARLITDYQQKKDMRTEDFLDQTLRVFSLRFIKRYYSTYAKSSLKRKKFYNIGAGYQRSRFPYWSYIDLISTSYEGNSPDIAFDLESLQSLPLANGEAEIIYNSYLLEHISLAATQNLIRESFRVLKPGGVFNCRVHSCTYGLHLFRHGIVPDKIFNSRESYAKMRDFLKKHLHDIDTENADNFVDGCYRITTRSGEYFEISPKDSFLSYNGTSLSKFVDDHPNYEGEIPPPPPAATHQSDPAAIYEQLKKYIDPSFQKKHPHTHNFQYIDAEILIKEMKAVGFSEAYIVDIGQSVAPPLWEECFNTHHSGFNFGVEAIK